MGAADVPSPRDGRADDGRAAAPAGWMGAAGPGQARDRRLGAARFTGGRDACAVLGSATAAATAAASRRVRLAVCRSGSCSLLGRARAGAVDRRRTNVGLAGTLVAACRGAFVGSAPGARASVGRPARARRRIAGDPVRPFLEPSARARLGRARRPRGLRARGAGRRRLGPAASGIAAGRAADRRSILGRRPGRQPFRRLGHPQDRRAGRAARTVMGRPGRAARSSRSPA